MTKEVKVDVGSGKRKFRRKQFTWSSSSTSFKKICSENSGCVSILSSKINNSFLGDEVNDSEEEYDEEFN